MFNIIDNFMHVLYVNAMDFLSKLSLLLIHDTFDAIIVFFRVQMEERKREKKTEKGYVF